jgi:hypothetical protein
VKTCEHVWRRSPERDSVKGDGYPYLYTEAVMVFWCEKCTEVKTQYVNVRIPDTVRNTESKP